MNIIKDKWEEFRGEWQHLRNTLNPVQPLPGQEITLLAETDGEEEAICRSQSLDWYLSNLVTSYIAMLIIIVEVSL